MKYLFFIPAFFCIIIFYSCSASTDKRYSGSRDETNKDVVKEKEPDKKVVEDFDFTPYRTKLDIPEKEVSIAENMPESEIWYGYEETEIDTSSVLNKKIIDKKEGYRVQVFTSDNLEEANNFRSEVYFNTTEKVVYVIFDPPFYKVMIGDFTEYSEAKDLSFKMSQLGYTESRVVNQTINIYEQ